ncbi:MAG: SPOR domain-containing protein [Thermoanaerobaculia bacterium]
MDQRKTHYQLSFTVRQALVLFVGLLLALSVAYFLGVMTGLAGREPGGAKASIQSPAAEEVSPGGASETASGEPRRAAQAAEVVASGATARPTAPPKLQLFEDRAGEDVTPARAAHAAPPPHGPAAPFWVQVASVRSEPEARAKSRKLSSHGYHATVEPVPGPKGTLYRVRVGPYRNREEASRAAERLSRLENVKAWIVPAGK